MQSAEDIKKKKAAAMNEANKILGACKKYAQSNLKRWVLRKNIKLLLTTINKQLEKCKNKLKTSQKQMDKYNNMLTATGKIHECPMCESKLRLCNDILVAVDGGEDTPDDDCARKLSDEEMVYLSLTSKVKKLEHSASRLGELVNTAELTATPSTKLDITDEQEAYDRLSVISLARNQIKSLKKKSLPKSIKRLQKNADDLKSQLPKEFKPKYAVKKVYFQGKDIRKSH